MSDLGIYVAVPFCQTKCTYCNFHTGVVAAERFGPYVEAVCEEIQGHAAVYAAAGIIDDAEGFSRPRGREKPAETIPQGLKPSNGKGLQPELELWETDSRMAEGIAAGDEKEVREVDTVYFGGGTPSLLEARDLGKILEAIQATFRIAGERGSRSGGSPYIRGRAVGKISEVTLEADPETVTGEKAAAWVAAGINRVSFGVQSFVDKELVAAGRMHRREDIYRAVPILRAAGITNISFDLIAGLAWQTRESWKESLDALVEMGPEHVSVYLLEVDEGSRLGAEILRGGEKYGAGQVPAEDVMVEFYDVAREKLRAAGYGQYEISNWAKAGKKSRHNLKYWRRQEYLGFGAGAHSFLGNWRWANAHDASKYVGLLSGSVEAKSGPGGISLPVFPMAASAHREGRLPVEQLEKITAAKALEEELFLGLRQLEGIDLERIEKQYGVTLAPKFDPLVASGWLRREGGVVRLAEERLSVSNEVFVELMK